MISIILLIITYLIYFLSRLIKFPSQRHRRLFFLVPTFTFTMLIIGLRDYSVGIDTSGYHVIFNCYHDISFSSIAHIQTHVEIGWAFFCWIVNEFGGNFRTFLIVYAIIFCILCGRILYVYDSYVSCSGILLATICFYSYTIFLTFNIARQMLAVALIMNSYDMFIKGKYGKYLLLTAIAFSFHLTAILGIIPCLLWLFRKYNMPLWTGIGCIILCIAIVPFVHYLETFNLYSNYLANTMNHFQTAGFAQLVWLIIIIEAVWVIINNFSYTKFIQLCASCSMICITLNVLGMQINYMERIGLYFVLFIPYLIIGFGNTIKNKSMRQIYFGCSILCYSVWFVISGLTEKPYAIGSDVMF